MIIDFWTGKEVKFDYTCDSCKYNIGNKKQGGKILEDVKQNMRQQKNMA